MNKVKLKGFFFLGFVFILFKLKEGTPPYPRAAGPRAWRDASGEPRQENRKTEIRKRTGKEIEKERKIRKTNAISYLYFQFLTESYFFFKLFPYLKRILRFDFFFRLIFKGISIIKLELILYFFRIKFFNAKLLFLGFVFYRYLYKLN